MRPGPRRRFSLSDRQVGILFMLPFIITASAFMVWPVVEAIRMSFYAYNPLRPDDIHWVGFANFERIFDDPLFW